MEGKIIELENFIEEWQDSVEKNKKSFLYFKNVLESLGGVDLEFIARPGVTYSLRGHHPKQQDRPLFVMVDVIEGEPRWLSVCFYANTIDDPEEKGDFVPQGLLGEDAICFDLDQYNEQDINYLQQRMEKAYGSIFK